jgi:hypothetical protein
MGRYSAARSLLATSPQTRNPNCVLPICCIHHLQLVNSICPRSTLNTSQCSYAGRFIRPPSELLTLPPAIVLSALHARTCRTNILLPTRLLLPPPSPRILSSPRNARTKRSQRTLQARMGTSAPKRRTQNPRSHSHRLRGFLHELQRRATEPGCCATARFETTRIGCDGG